MQGFKPGKNARCYEGHYPHIIHPLTDYWRYCNDPEALAFARAMADGFLADIQPRHLHQPDGSLRGHNHVQMHAVRGVAQLGAIIHEPRYLEWAKAVYKYYNDNGFDTGWLPECRELADHNNHSEMCLVGDMTEIEVWLARAGWPGYWDRVDRTIRNIIVPGQFVLTPALERMWREIHKDKSPAEIEQSMQLLKDIQGGFLSGLTPNDWVFEVNPKGSHDGTVVYRGRKIVLDMMGCCPPEGMRALYLAWRDTVQETPAGVMVNLAFDRGMPNAKVASQMPRKGQMTVTAKAEADFLLRVPGWVPRSAVRASRDGKLVDVKWGGPAFAYVLFPKAKPGESLEITWPLVKFTQRVSHKIFDGTVECAYTYTWIGSTVTSVDCPGNGFRCTGEENEAGTKSSSNRTSRSCINAKTMAVSTDRLPVADVVVVQEHPALPRGHVFFATDFEGGDALKRWSGPGWVPGSTAGMPSWWNVRRKKAAPMSLPPPSCRSSRCAAMSCSSRPESRRTA